jgi:putative acetyltransferase
VSTSHHLAQVTIQRETPDQPEVHRLFQASDAYAASLYPAESNHMVDVTTLLQPNVIFLVARMGEAAVGCGAAVLHSEDPNDSYAEIKRMFVDERGRGLGVGRRILQALEAAVAATGMTVARLETGVINYDAIRLYERDGYRRTGPFGDYWDDPLSVFYEKDLTRDVFAEVEK